MKNKVVLLAIIYAIAANSDVFAFRWPSEATSNYVVIGAFAIESHAVEHVETAKKLKYNAVYEINPNRHLFYVYVLRTNDATAAFNEASRIRKETPFWDTWVYNGLLGLAPAGKTSDVPPVEKQITTNGEIKDTSAPLSAQSKDTTSQVIIADVQNTTPVLKEGEKNFLFRIFSPEGAVEGDIDVIDVEKTKKVASYKGNQQVVVHAVNKSGNMAFVCEVFGYRKLQKNLNFNQPQDTEGVVIEDGEIRVPFELVHLKKGDTSVMYNVYFFKDAAIMRPESKYEVENLTNMMKGNLKYKIRIHGHTNGNSAGKVISMGDSKNFFSLNNTKDGYGSAKKLSQERAEVIRDFLISQGIDGKRMEIKAWGGKRPLYDKMSPQAQANVRVEIEILEDK